MSTPVARLKQRDDPIGGLFQAAPAAIGSVVGGIYGGPAGAAAGGQLGGMVSQGMKKEEGGPVASTADVGGSTPAARKLDQIEKSDTEILRKGRAALERYDEETKAALAPALEQALKKAAENQQMKGYSNGGSSSIT